MSDQVYLELIKKLKADPDAALTELSKLLMPSQAAALAARVAEYNSKETKATRFGLYPIQDMGSFKLCKALQGQYWVADELKFSEDLNDFNNLTLSEQNLLLTIFGFFAIGDGVISSMLAYQMMLINPSMSKSCFYALQLANEMIHAETYGQMIFTLVSDPIKRDEIFNAVSNVESIKNLSKFVEDSFLNPSGDRDLYFALAAAEYVFFTPMFCCIFWFRAFKPGKIHNIILSNTFIARDEGLHCKNGCYNYFSLPREEKFTQGELNTKIQEVVSLVDKFTEYMFVSQNIKMGELNLANTNQYVRYVADDLLVRMGHKVFYNVSNPYVWMDYTSLVPKENFYEKVVTNYSRVDVEKSVKLAEQLMLGKSAVQPTVAIEEVKALVIKETPVPDDIAF